MANNSSENYLDKLLFSVEDGTSSPPEQDLLDESPEDTIERELFGVDNSEETRRAKDEEAFLREFEEELLKEEIDQKPEPKVAETVTPKPETPEPEPKKGAEGTGSQSGMKESLDDMIDRVAKQMDEQKASAVDGNAGSSGEQPESGLDDAVGAFDGKHETAGEELPVTDDGELDLSGLGNRDILDVLSGDGELSDLGDMLSDEAEGNMLDQEDSIGDFARAEMAEGGQESEEGDSKEGKKSRKKKKDRKKDKNNENGKDKEGGFLSKLSRIFFGEEEDEEKETDTVKILENTGADVSELSEENQQILAELEAAGGVEAAEKAKKKKKEKKPKQKKKKAPKPKKEKKPKPKKEKKPKKPKEVDNTPPLPKKPVIAIIIMAASLFGFVILTTNLLGYRTSITQAKDAFEEGAYVEAYQSIQGLQVKKDDEALYQKLSVLATISEKYNSYLIFQNNGKKDLALDSLICAFGRCELNEKNAKKYEFEPELEEIKGKILTTLLSEYNLTGEDVLELYHAKTRKAYTLQLREVIEKLGLE